MNLSDSVAGTLALVGGGEWGRATRDLDAALLEASGGKEVVVLPTAAAFEDPWRVCETAAAHFDQFGARTRALNVLHRRDGSTDEVVETLRDARFVYLSDGSPLHLRSVLKGSAMFEAVLAAYRSGAVVAASGAGATVVCDPMVDPRGGAYTVGLGLVEGLAIFPYHGTAADHLRERSIDLLPDQAVLAGVDEGTALVRSPGAKWSVGGDGSVTVYSRREPERFLTGSVGLPLP
ncbi:MAG TPA: Type 1 glutamine amidotransferase-like domain-containing protein [Acidimicrobiia bacterium]|jgi:cyanophycinase